MARFYLILFLLLPVYCFPQEQGSFPAIDQSDFPDAVFGTPKTYTGSSLFGYINGGAELYLEYGFSGAWVDEISYMGGKYTVEIYRMNGPEEAFGIFSVSRFRCNSIPPLSPFTCHNPYQLQICSGLFYISIINESATSRDSIASLRIGEAIVKNIRDRSVNLSSWMPDISTEIIKREAVLVRGNLGIMNGAPDLAGLFDGFTGYTALVLPQEKLTIVSVRFNDRESALKFSENKQVTWLAHNHIFARIPK